MLSDDELETEQFLCHGESTLVYAQEDATICNGLGGIVFRTGIDANDDSTISEIESIHEVTACNGASGLTTLTETASASFRDCPDGGYLLKMGLDTNQNQTLENNELINVNPLCHGEDGSPAISLNEALASIPGCPNQGPGVQIRSGNDSNRDGLIDESELRSVSKVCDGVDGKDGFTSLVALETLPPDSEACGEHNLLAYFIGWG